MVVWLGASGNANGTVVNASATRTEGLLRQGGSTHDTYRKDGSERGILRRCSARRGGV
ncbi:hypothetical protein GCM10017600_60630 [Streptosporangium carneum]|uniref:Uncharacterized protein n=1 Tax=Streptosporangium carneum TaxID=47481 RepID=A0A9W6I7K4_9ACTN|nr:hypothetical protein GCM10017600_60630 [Streptosporangium carneum]